MKALSNWPGERGRNGDLIERDGTIAHSRTFPLRATEQCHLGLSNGAFMEGLYRARGMDADPGRQLKALTDRWTGGRVKRDWWRIRWRVLMDVMVLRGHLRSCDG